MDKPAPALDEEFHQAALLAMSEVHSGNEAEARAILSALVPVIMAEITVRHFQIRQAMMGAQGTADMARRHASDLAARLRQWEDDMAAAAGELPIPVPEPGTPMAKALAANVLARRALADRESVIRQQRERVAALVDERNRATDATALAMEDAARARQAVDQWRSKAERAWGDAAQAKESADLFREWVRRLCFMIASAHANQEAGNTKTTEESLANLEACAAAMREAMKAGDL